MRHNPNIIEIMPILIYNKNTISFLSEVYFMNNGDKMSTKNNILELLEKNRGKSLSGKLIANSLQISRSAVWKAVKSLERDGHNITAVTNKGYTLSNDNNILSVQGILPYLLNKNYAAKIHLYKSLESTNRIAKEMAIAGHEHGTVVIADSQTFGKGRYGKSFYSPPGSGLYMSFILRSKFLRLPATALITTSAAVNICRAIQAVTGKGPQIKWVNDILLNGKKIGGILTEAITDFESGNMDWIVIGIGINVCTCQSDFPEGLSRIAGSIYPDGTDGATRNRLAAEIINKVIDMDTWANDYDIYKEYKQRSALLGNRITVIKPNETYGAIAIDIDTDGQLIVQKDNCEIAALSSGEVSIKF